MPAIITPLTNYPTLQDVANLLRTIVNDDGAGATGTVGEGQIVVDNQAVSVKVINSINSALGWLYTSLGNTGDPALIFDNYVLKNLPVLHGANGVGSPDPATQVVLTYAGFFDGTIWHPEFRLPADMLQPTRMWQRLTSSNLPFKPITQAQDGLPPNWQGNYLGEWEYREDGIWFNGAIENCDIRIRGRRKLPFFHGSAINFTTTYIPVMECVNAVAYKAAALIEGSIGMPDVETMRSTQADNFMFLLRNAKVRRNQGVNYSRPSYGDTSGVGLGIGFDW